MPLTTDTKVQHDYFFESALVDVVIQGQNVARIAHSKKHEKIEALRSAEHAGLVLFLDWDYWTAKSDTARSNALYAAV